MPFQSNASSIDPTLSLLKEHPNAAKDIKDLQVQQTLDFPTFVEIERFLIGFPTFADSYLPIGKIGEGRNIVLLSLGTFSTVYKALDLHHHKFNNQTWHKDSADSESKHCQTQELLALEMYANFPEKFEHLTEVSSNATAIWRALFRKALSFYRDTNIDPVFVALKRINPTSSPDRILDEISFISDVRYLLNESKFSATSFHENIVNIISVQRHEDQIIVITPYFQHFDFRVICYFIDALGILSKHGSGADSSIYEEPSFCCQACSRLFHFT